MIAKFEINKTYKTNSVCDSECIFKFKVLKRTEKSVWIIDAKESNPITIRKKIDIFDNTESIFPLGKYSMAPILRAG